MTWALTLVSGKWRWVAFGVFGLMVLGIIALRVFYAGKAAAKLEVAAEVLSSALRAAKVRDNVDHSKEAVRNDPRNRDNH